MTGKILFAEQDGVRVLKFVGDVRLTMSTTLSRFLAELRAAKNFEAMVIDLSEAEAIDSTALGLIAKIAICTREVFSQSSTVFSPNPDITRVLTSMAMEQVCLIVDHGVNPCGEMAELPIASCSEDDMRERVLDAHRVLMSLNDKNRDAFQDLVEALENEKQHPPIAGTG